VFGDDMGLDFFGTSPQETAEWAWAPLPVYVSQVPFEVLGAGEAFVALYTSMLLHSRAAAHASTFAAVLGSLDNFTPSCSARLRLGYVSMHSDHGFQRWVLASKEGMLDCGPNMEMGNASAIV
jgi:hypothetical protein